MKKNVKKHCKKIRESILDALALCANEHFQKSPEAYNSCEQCLEKTTELMADDNIYHKQMNAIITKNDVKKLNEIKLIYLKIRENRENAAEEIELAEKENDAENNEGYETEKVKKQQQGGELIKQQERI